jgi:hypothetical protein
LPATSSFLFPSMWIPKRNPYLTGSIIVFFYLVYPVLIASTKRILNVLPHFTQFQSNINLNCISRLWLLYHSWAWINKPFLLSY